MQDKSYWLFYVFVECMIYNNRSFCEDDFKALLDSQRLSQIKMNFNDEVKDFVDECKILDQKNYNYRIPEPIGWQDKVDVNKANTITWQTRDCPRTFTYDTKPSRRSCQTDTSGTSFACATAPKSARCLPKWFRCCATPTSCTSTKTSRFLKPRSTTWHPCPKS